jgi:hypothetical protein
MSEVVDLPPDTEIYQEETDIEKIYILTKGQI